MSRSFLRRANTPSWWQGPRALDGLSSRWSIAREGLARQVLLNQVEEREDWAAAQAFARALEGSGIGVWAGSLRRGLCRRA